MSPKYGVPLTNEGWKGLPIRVGEFGLQGRLEGLVAADDALLVWSGGKSEVQLAAKTPEGNSRHRFIRYGGMIDLLPKGLVFDEVLWTGQASTCVSVALEADTIERMLGEKAAFQPDRLRLALNDPHVVDLVQRLREQAHLNEPWGTMYVEALSLTVASYIYGRYGSGIEVRVAPRTLSPSQAGLLVEFIEEHLAEAVSLMDLSALIGYSPDHFARLFKAKFGRPPHKYILERRIERAKALLADHRRSIADVAISCGFASQQHLNTAFKAQAGVSPGVYRKSRVAFG
jgi:AraC family transcriptional regulator